MEVSAEPVKAFLQEAQEYLKNIVNERKAILRPEVSKETTKVALKSLLDRWKELKIETLDKKQYESVLEGQKIFLTVALIYSSFYDDEEVTEPIVALHETVEEGITGLEGEGPVKDSDSTEIQSDKTDREVVLLDTSFLKREIERLCQILRSGSTQDSNIIKNITLTRKLKLQIVLLTLIYYSIETEIITEFQDTAVNFSHEDMFAVISRIIPRVYNYNLYMKYYDSFLHNFTMSLKTGKLKNLLISIVESVGKQFPKFQLSFDERHGTVMKKLGMESFNLEDCCDRIDTRASSMSFDSPIDMAKKMMNIWLLLDASEFLTFDDNTLSIYVFSSDLSIYHEQIMRIFYVINRIDEVVRDVGYKSYSSPRFVHYYSTLYIEIHAVFTRLIRALSKNYEIYELESDPRTGAIKRKSEASAFIAAKLKELCIYFTCPLACLDSILRLSLERSDIPVLFGEEEERFIFTAPVQSILVLHDFVASDREKFAEFMVELYPCLDRHFSRFHKSKKMQSQGPITALPPSYHLFAAKPPSYANINDNENPGNDLEMQAPPSPDLETRCASACKKFGPAVFFLFLILVFIFFLIEKKIIF